MCGTCGSNAAGWDRRPAVKGHAGGACTLVLVRVAARGFIAGLIGRSRADEARGHKDELAFAAQVTRCGTLGLARGISSGGANPSMISGPMNMVTCILNDSKIPLSFL